MFSLHDFLMQGFTDAIGKLADYQIILNATGWYEKAVLTESDLAQLNELITQKNYVSTVGEDSSEVTI